MKKILWLAWAWAWTIGRTILIFNTCITYDFKIIWWRNNYTWNQLTNKSGCVNLIWWLFHCNVFNQHMKGGLARHDRQIRLQFPAPGSPLCVPRQRGKGEDLPHQDPQLKIKTGDPYFVRCYQVLPGTPRNPQDLRAVIFQKAGKSTYHPCGNNHYESKELK